LDDELDSPKALPNLFAQRILEGIGVICEMEKYCATLVAAEAARVLAEGGAEIIFRSMLASTVGNLPEVPHMAAHYGQAAILTPSDYFFARDGIAAEGTFNQEQMVISDVDLDILDEQRVTGTVIPPNDLIKNAYDRVIHCEDKPIQREEYRHPRPLIGTPV
jgi:hypothetical protein